ncbi:MAG: FAD-dependent oxidoreductase, partial [Pseudomonadota bacterium]
AEQILADGYADLVNLGRVLIADPEWPIKAQEGRADEIRPCVACNQGCTDRVFTGQPVFCVGNPRAGYEAERVISEVSVPKKVLVAGAGPGGLEAAVTAAQAGHDVSLYEKAREIGGQLWLAGAPPHKNDLWEFVRYYRAMIYRTSVKLHLNTEVTADLIRSEAPDHVIVAEGAEPLVPPIQGVDDSSVIGAWEVLSENPFLGKNVAVVGGGSVGLETAIFVAHKGVLSPEVVHFLLAYEAMDPARIRKLMFSGSTSVTVFEMLDRAGKDVGKSTKWVLFDNLRRFKVDVKTSTRVLSIEDGVLTWEKDGKTGSKKFDQVILASGSRPKQTLSKLVESLGVPFTTVGDCRGIGRIQDAVHGGFLAALALSS